VLEPNFGFGLGVNADPRVFTAGRESDKDIVRGGRGGNYDVASLCNCSLVEGALFER
jgi:hypothetical protein